MVRLAHCSAIFALEGRMRRMRVFSADRSYIVRWWFARVRLIWSRRIVCSCRFSLMRSWNLQRDRWNLVNANRKVPNRTIERWWCVHSNFDPGSNVLLRGETRIRTKNECKGLYQCSSRWPHVVWPDHVELEQRMWRESRESMRTLFLRGLMALFDSDLIR